MTHHGLVNGILDFVREDAGGEAGYAFLYLQGINTRHPIVSWSGY